MKLLLDENLSPRLVARLAHAYPGSVHVRGCGLLSAPDTSIWVYARESGFVIASKDSDFLERSYLEGAPPKVVYLDVGNAGTSAIASLLLDQRSTLTAFADSVEASALILSVESERRSI